MPALVIAALIIVAAPATLAVQSFSEAKDNGHHEADDHDNDTDEDQCEFTYVNGTVTAFLYDDYEENETDDDDSNETAKMRVCAFVIDNSTIVSFGPWWYWVYNGTNITDFVHIDDEVNVTGMLEEEDGTAFLEAWHIENLTTDEELTIKEEGRPPWAGGPKGLGIDPWPLSDEDD